MSAGEQLLSARLKLKRADKHVTELDEALGAYKRIDPVRIVAHRDPQTQELIYWVAEIKPVPHDISLIASDVLGNLRSALDHTVFQLWRVGERNAGSEKAVGFPIYGSASDYDAKKVGKVSGLSAAAVKAIDAIEPYKGGNGHALWVLDNLNNIAKHRLLLAVGGSFTALDVAPILNRSLVKIGLPPLIQFPVEAPAVGFRCPLKAGDVLLRTPPHVELQEDTYFKIEVAFGEPHVSKSDPLFVTLRNLSQFVHDVVDQLGRLV